MFKCSPTWHSTHRAYQTRIVKLLGLLLSLCVLMLSMIKPAHAYLDITAPQTYYSWTGSYFYVVPGARSLGTYRLTSTSVTDWYYVPWETIHTNNPGSASLPTFYKGLSAMIAEGRVSGGIRWSTIQTDSLGACTAYRQYLYLSP